VDGRGNAVYFEHTVGGQTRAETNALGDTTYWDYDLAGRQSVRTDPDDRITHCYYDAAGLVSARQHLGDSAAYFAYNENAGRTMMQDPTSTTYWTYDALDRMIIEEAIGGHRTAFYYDNRSDLRTVPDPENGLTYYTYDAANRQTSVKNPWAEVTYYEYTPAGRLTKRTLGNEAVTYHEYDAAGRASEVDNRKSDMSVISSFEYARDENGNPVSIVREDGYIVYYEYDAKNQLTSELQRDDEEQDVYAYEWDYDAAGNREYQTFNTVTTYYEYNAANELTEETTGADTTYYYYDHSGNTVAKQEAAGATYCQYDHENLMTRTDFADASHNYFAYDADSKRVEKRDSEGYARFIYQGPNMLALLQEQNESEEAVVHYTMGDGLEAMRRANGGDIETGASSFYHFDALGSTFDLSASDETISDTYLYNAWGEILHRTGTTVNPHTYVGKKRYYLTPDPALHLLGLRYYSALLARFVSVDPAKAGGNWYLYAENIPLSRYDSSGLVDVQLTFDDGPAGASISIMAALARHGNPKVGFFWVGKRMRSGLGRLLVRVAEAAGHIVANHSYSHALDSDNKFYTTLTKQRLEWEICMWELAYKRATHKDYGPPKHWRAPAWDYDQRVSGVFAGEHYSPHSGAHIRSRDAWPHYFQEKRLARCVLKWIKQCTDPTTLVVGWHDERGTAPVTPDAIEVFLTEAHLHGITVVDYDATKTGVVGKPTEIDGVWMTKCMLYLL